MNTLYALTCLAIIAGIVHSMWVARQGQSRIERLARLIDPLIQSYLAPAQEGEVPSESQMTAEEELVQTALFNNGGDVRFKEYELRRAIETLTMDILRRHTYHLSYADAWNKAEEYILAEFASRDKPLSEKMLKLIGEVSPSPEPQIQPTLQ